MDKPILCVDFDGVIHSYERGWQGGEIYGTTTTGFFEWLLSVSHVFRVVVYSSRSKDPEMLGKMQSWLFGQCEEWEKRSGLSSVVAPMMDRIEFAHEKPPAFLTIDDRALTFRGSWDDFPVHKLMDFKAWNSSPAFG